MPTTVSISIYELTGTAICVASEDGEKVHNQIAAALNEGHNVNVSFKNVTSLTSAFLNSAIGQLYGNFDEAFIKSHLSVSDIESDDLLLLKRVVDTAKEYFKNAEKIDKLFPDDSET